MSELSADAKAELAKAIAIVREDRIDQLLRKRLATPKEPDPKTPDAPLNPATDPLLVPPPPNPDPKPPITDPPNPPDDGKRRSAYWGEIYD